MRNRLLIVTAVGIVVLAACGDSQDAAPAEIGEPVSAETFDSKLSESETEALTAGELADGYMRDRAGMDARLMGNPVVVTGAVSTFGTNKKNMAYIELQGAARNAPIQCVFAEPGPKEAFSDLTPGLKATVSGVVEGYKDTVKDEEGQVALFQSVGDIPTLGDCKLVE